MSVATISMKTGRVLLVGFGILLVAGFSWTGWCFYVAAGLRQEIQALTITIANTEQRLRSFTIAGSQQEPPDEAYLQGNTLAIAAAALQTAVTGAIRKAGGQVIESGREQALVTPDNEGEREGEIYLRVAFHGDTQAVQRALYDIESGQPWMVVRNLAIIPFGTQADEPQLRAQMLVGAQWGEPR